MCGVLSCFLKIKSQSVWQNGPLHQTGRHQQVNSVSDTNDNDYNKGTRLPHARNQTLPQNVFPRRTHKQWEEFCATLRARKQFVLCTWMKFRVVWGSGLINNAAWVWWPGAVMRRRRVRLYLGLAGSLTKKNIILQLTKDVFHIQGHSLQGHSRQYGFFFFLVQYYFFLFVALQSLQHVLVPLFCIKSICHSLDSFKGISISSDRHRPSVNVWLGNMARLWDAQLQ